MLIIYRYNRLKCFISKTKGYMVKHHSYAFTNSWCQMFKPALKIYIVKWGNEDLCFCLIYQLRENALLKTLHILAGIPLVCSYDCQRHYNLTEFVVLSQFHRIYLSVWVTLIMYTLPASGASPCTYICSPYWTCLWHAFLMFM